MNLFWQVLQVPLWIFLASVIAGAIAYGAQRLRRSVPPPTHGTPVRPVPLAGVLCQARQDVLVISLAAAITVLLLVGGSIDIPWAASATTAIWALTCSTPSAVTWSRIWRSTVLTAAAVLAVVIGRLVQRTTAIDQLLMLFLALGGVVLWMRVRCQGSLPEHRGKATTAIDILHEWRDVHTDPSMRSFYEAALEVARTTSLTGTPEEQAMHAVDVVHARSKQQLQASQERHDRSVQRLAQQRQGSAPAACIRLARTPAAILEAVAKQVVGQNSAVAAWQRLLESESAFFSPNSTRPLSVLQVGPASTGKEALCRALTLELGIHTEVVAGEQLGVSAGLVLQGKYARPDCLVVTHCERIPEALRGEVTDLVLGRLPYWNQTIFIFLFEAVAPDPALEQATLRDLLVGAGLDRGLALGVRAIVPFVALEPWALAGVAAKVLSDEAQSHGMELRWLDPEALDEVVAAIPAAARDQGAAGVAYGIAHTIGRKLDDAKGHGWTSIRVEKTPAGVAVLQES